MRQDKAFATLDDLSIPLPSVSWVDEAKNMFANGGNSTHRLTKTGRNQPK